MMGHLRQIALNLDDSFWYISSTLHGLPRQTPQMDTFCPGPLRRFLTPEAILKLDAFDDWFVRMHISEHTAVDASPETPISETSSPEPRRTFPFRHYDDGEKDEESLGRESPEPQRLFPVHQYHSTLYDHPQPALQMKTFCPGPLKRFLTPEAILKFEAFND